MNENKLISVLIIFIFSYTSLISQNDNKHFVGTWKAKIKWDKQKEFDAELVIDSAQNLKLFWINNFIWKKKIVWISSNINVNGADIDFILDKAQYSGKLVGDSLIGSIQTKKGNGNWKAIRLTSNSYDLKDKDILDTIYYRFASISSNQIDYIGYQPIFKNGAFGRIINKYEMPANIEKLFFNLDLISFSMMKDSKGKYRYSLNSLMLIPCLIESILNNELTIKYSSYFLLINAVTNYHYKYELIEDKFYVSAGINTDFYSWPSDGYGIYSEAGIGIEYKYKSLLANFSYKFPLNHTRVYGNINSYPTLSLFYNFD